MIPLQLYTFVREGDDRKNDQGKIVSYAIVHVIGKSEDDARSKDKCLTSDYILTKTSTLSSDWVTKQ